MTFVFCKLLLYLYMVMQVVKSNGSSPNHKQYCVIGAGPGGLQSAYFLQKSQRDYIVFEKGLAAGTFYTKYPIHRLLISINKRNTGKTNKEFNFRHDWNSLISDDESLQMTKYSKELFPPADSLVQYLNDYQRKLNIKVQYNTTISNIHRKEGGSIYYMDDQFGNNYSCQFLIVATGISKPNVGYKEAEPGIVTKYDDISLDLNDYEGKSVLIMGHGNSAFETAQHIMPVTNVVHLMARNPIRLAWSTHYVGDLRAINNGPLDTYQLKSLDGIFESDASDFTFTRSPLTGRIYLVVSEEWGLPGKELDAIDNSATREGYDIVISCLGFEFDDSLFHKNLTFRRPRQRSIGKYPGITYAYEALGNKGMYFAGTNTHSLDFRKSAGGFIHGYRYSGKALHNILEWKNHGVQWPSVRFDNILDLMPHILKRVNEASDIYQMFGVLCDVVIYSNDQTSATYLNAVPCSLTCKLHKLTGHPTPGPIMIVALEYGKNFSGMDKNVFSGDRARGQAYEAHDSNFLHPVFYYYKKPFNDLDFLNKPKSWIVPLPDKLHHVIEDFVTKFNGHSSHITTLRRFLETTTGRDLRYFFADDCMKLALTMSTLPLGCISNKNHPPSNLLVPDIQLKTGIASMDPLLLPFRSI